MNIQTKLTVCCATVLAVVSTATAENEQSGGQNPSWQKPQAEEFFRASNIIGKDTQTSDNQKPGSIKDLVFNQKGEIFALVDVGNSKLAVVPWQAVKPASAKGTENARIDTTLQTLKSGPAVTKDQWGALDNPSFVQGVYSYYHIQEPTAVGGASTPGGTQHGSNQPSQSDLQQQK